MKEAPTNISEGQTNTQTDRVRYRITAELNSDESMFCKTISEVLQIISELFKILYKSNLNLQQLRMVFNRVCRK